MQEFVRRGLGKGNLGNIEIVGMSRGEVEENFKSLRKELRTKYNTRPRPPSVARTIDKLTEEGWMNKPRTVLEVLDELKKRGVGNATDHLVSAALKRRRGKTLDGMQSDGELVYQSRKK